MTVEASLVISTVLLGTAFITFGKTTLMLALYNNAST